MNKGNQMLAHRLGMRHQFKRLIWSFVWSIFIRPIPRSYFNSWKVFILNRFGAKIEKSALVYSSAKIYDPSKLIMKAESVLGPDVDCYNVDFVILEEKSIVSQKVYLCTASHDFTIESFPLITAPITISKNAWVAADAYVGMGVNVGENAIVGARSSVFKDVEPNAIVGGNPAKFIKKRK